MKNTLFILTLLFLAACDVNELITDAGPQRVMIHEMAVDSLSVSEVMNHKFPASNAYGSYLHVGQYSQVENAFFLKFSDLDELTYLDDSVDFVIDAAELVLYPSRRWPADAAWPSPVLAMVQSDSASLWYSTTDMDSLFDIIEPGFTAVGASLTEDSDTLIVLDLDRDVMAEYVNSWFAGYVNTGMVMLPSGTDSVMQSVYSRDYSYSIKSPFLRLYVSLVDTADGAFVGLDTLVLPSSADLTRSISAMTAPENAVFAAAAQIYQGSFSLEALRDSLSREKIIDYADLTIDVQSMIMEADDSLLVTLMIKRPSGTDEYESVSGMAVVDTVTAGTPNLKFSLPSLIQFLISGGRDEDLRFFVRFNDEYNHYSRMVLDPSSLKLNLNYADVE